MCRDGDYRMVCCRFTQKRQTDKQADRQTMGFNHSEKHPSGFTYFHIDHRGLLRIMLIKTSTDIVVDRGIHYNISHIMVSKAYL